MSVWAQTFGNLSTSLVSQKRKPQFLKIFTGCLAHLIIRTWLAVFVSALSPFFEKIIGFVFRASRSGVCNMMRTNLISKEYCICDEMQRHVDLILLPDSSAKLLHDVDALSNG